MGAAFYSRGHGCSEDITLNLCTLTTALILMVPRPITELGCTERAVFPGTSPSRLVPEEPT